MPGVTSDIIFNEIKNKNKRLVTKQELLKDVKDHNFDVLLTLGAGDIDDFVVPIKNILNQEK